MKYLSILIFITLSVTNISNYMIVNSNYKTWEWVGDPSLVSWWN